MELIKLTVSERAVAWVFLSACSCAAAVLGGSHSQIQRFLLVGSDHQAHYLFIGSSRRGDLTVETTRRGGERAPSPHAD